MEGGAEEAEEQEAFGEGIGRTAGCTMYTSALGLVRRFREQHCSTHEDMHTPRKLYMLVVSSINSQGSKSTHT